MLFETLGKMLNLLDLSTKPCRVQAVPAGVTDEALLIVHSRSRILNQKSISTTMQNFAKPAGVAGEALFRVPTTIALAASQHFR